MELNTLYANNVQKELWKCLMKLLIVLKFLNGDYIKKFIDYDKLEDVNFWMDKSTDFLFISFVKDLYVERNKK